jgi:F-type H+-transporting ATPase subunit b
MDPTFWALMGLLVFFAILIYYKLPSFLGSKLDDRARLIRKELEEARQLREEAQSVLADYERKRAKVDEEAEAILKQAELEADRLTQETEKALEDLIERRTQSVEFKIKQAEQQALQDVRERAAQLSIAATSALLQDKLSGVKADELIKDSLSQIDSHLH